MCAFLVAAVLAGVYLLPEEKTVINEIVMTWLPYFAFIMYAINRGTNFTQALFMNCDHCRLTYSFYKQPNFILRLFQIRLREIIDVYKRQVIEGGKVLLRCLQGFIYALADSDARHNDDKLCKAVQTV